MLLHALPSMAGDKGCVSLILKLLGSFGSKPSLTPLRLNLLLKLWRVEPRVFQFLHKAGIHIIYLSGGRFHTILNSVADPLPLAGSGSISGNMDPDPGSKNKS